MAFPVRLDKKQEKKFEKVRALLKIATSNKAIIELIMRFERDQKEIARLTKLCEKQSQQLSELKYLFNERDSINNKIERLIKKK